MPKYALLGATGATGSSALRCLLEEAQSDLTVNIFVRSKSKLLKAFPELESTSSPKISIFEGTLSEDEVLQQCLSGVTSIFMCIASNDSSPGQTTSQDATTAIVDALKSNREKQGAKYTTPTVLMLRSATLNDTFGSQTPWVRIIVHWMLKYCYDDIEAGCNILAQAGTESEGLLEWIYVDSGSIHNADGRERTGHKLITSGPLSSEITYADLGAGFCELAKRQDEFLRQGVGVSATGYVKQTWGVLIPALAFGVKSRIIG